MMEIVIKIPDEMIKALEQGSFGAKYNMYDLVGYVLNGTPLPKGHGDLYDGSQKVDVLLYDEQYDEYGEVTMTLEEYINRCTEGAEPIIEADEEE